MADLRFKEQKVGRRVAAPARDLPVLTDEERDAKARLFIAHAAGAFNQPQNLGVVERQTPVAVPNWLLVFIALIALGAAGVAALVAR